MLPTDPAKLERATRRWPVRRTLLMTFEAADAAEAELKAAGYETARLCWGGQHLEVRARKPRKKSAREVEREFYGDVLGED